ncbi:hypothetical protein MO973_23155 [Paenibacillus sp. TRM 82003]|nr:hypothetical protein [Paenibacillus sp. TRM 82003]
MEIIEGDKPNDGKEIEMNVHMVLFISSSVDRSIQGIRIKTFESDIRPMKGDIIHDPGFHPRFHNGYEVVRVTLHYAENECWVSLSPLAIELEEIPVQSYLAHLEANGWREVTREELQTL